jgi:hypothetical protein
LAHDRGIAEIAKPNRKRAQVGGGHRLRGASGIS